MSEYIANGGQTYFPIQENIHVDFVPFQHPAKPKPLLKPLELSDSYLKNGFVLSSQKQHFLPGVTAEMLDWFWANMENGPVRLEAQK